MLGWFSSHHIWALILNHNNQKVKTQKNGQYIFSQKKYKITDSITVSIVILQSHLPLLDPGKCTILRGRMLSTRIDGKNLAVSVKSAVASIPEEMTALPVPPSDKFLNLFLFIHISK